MDIELFYHMIKDVIHGCDFINPSFINLCNEIFEDKESNYALQMTRMTVLFESFYRVASFHPLIKKQLSDLRIMRWKNHFGVPTISFLLTYRSQIEQISDLLAHEASHLSIENLWEICIKKNLVFDKENNVLIDDQFTNTVASPKEYEKNGHFLKTLNPNGGFIAMPCDPISLKFIEYAHEVAIQDGVMLEIGAGFGAATLQALQKGATIFCNDIDPNNLAIVKKRHLKNNQINEDKLILVPGAFPDELIGFPRNYFDAILVSRVLHFFSGEKIEESCECLLALLKPGGKLFIICETPYLKNWQKFIPEYEKRVANKIKWPGEITNPSYYENSGRAESLPKFVHWITKEILERSLKLAKFEIEHLSYIDRKGQFPKDLLLDGKESIGAIATKLA